MPEPRLILEPAAALDERDRTLGSRAGGNGDPLLHFDVARHSRPHLILDLCALRGDGVLDLQTDHRISWNHELVIQLPRRFRDDGRAFDGRVFQRLDRR